MDTKIVKDDKVGAVQVQMDQVLLDQKLQLLKGLDLEGSVVNVYVVKISQTNKSKRFQKVNRLICHDDLKAQFKSYVVDCISKNSHISQLRDITTNQDNRFFYVESAASDFSQVVSTIESDEIVSLSDLSTLNKFNGYAIQLTFGEPEKSIFAFRYISTAWSVKNSAGKALSFNMLKNELVAGINNEPYFQITPYIDFIQSGDDMFISSLQHFETAMNYHERLKEKKAETITALCASNALSISYSDLLSKSIGSDKHLMRQLASVYAKGYYNNDVWIEQLKKAAIKAGNWLVQFDDDGTIQVQGNKEYIRELLTLLQNKRVKTVVDGVVFDVDGELITLTTDN